MAVLCLFACLIFVPFYGMPFHIDEPYFLVFARAILNHPIRPFDSPGPAVQGVPLWRVNNGCPLSFELIALALKATGGGEWAVRFFFLPFDLAAALGLYLIASRFLKRPLWPTLVIIAAPAYFLNMAHLMGEKFAAAFGFWGIYSLIKGIDDKKPAWFWLSAPLMSATILAKASIGFLLAPCLGYALVRRVPARRLAGYFLLSLSFPLAYLLYYSLCYGQSIPFLIRSAAAKVSSLQSAHLAYQVRSFLAFIGGGGVVTAFWSFAAFRPKKSEMAALFLAGLVLYSPLFDYGAFVRLEDRAMGVGLALGAAWGLWCCLKPRAGRAAWAIWVPWICAGAAVLFKLWFMSARLVTFLLPPLVFTAAQALEERWEASALTRLYAASLALTLAVSLPLSLVDDHFARAQKQFAQKMRTDYIARGRRVWFTGAWGFEYYMEQIGARDIDPSAGGWGAVRAGDIVAVSALNLGMMPLPSPLPWRYSVVSVADDIPLRLLGSPEFKDQSGFYANITGFLPYSFTLRPLDYFLILEVR